MRNFLVLGNRNTQPLLRVIQYNIFIIEYHFKYIYLAPEERMQGYRKAITRIILLNIPRYSQLSRLLKTSLKVHGAFYDEFFSMLQMYNMTAAFTVFAVIKWNWNQYRMLMWDILTEKRHSFFVWNMEIGACVCTCLWIYYQT